MSDVFFLNTLPDATARLVQTLQSKPLAFLDNFYLSGGTALSLQIGHRESEDLDFFSAQPFNPLKLQEQLAVCGTLSQLELAEGTLNAYIDGVKIQFLEYPYALLESFNLWQKMQLSSVLDIACTKLQTIGMRGSKKDFIDVYFLLKKYTLLDLFSAMEKKYTNVQYSQTHILKSLVYFVDAEQQPMPRMHKDVSWDAVKIEMIQQIKHFSLA